MIWAVFHALLSHWRYRPLQLVTLVLGIGLATALWSGVQAINAEARASYARSASIIEQGSLPRLIAKDGGLIASENFGALRRAGWNVSPVIEGDYRFNTVRIRLIGVDPLTMTGEGGPVKIARSSDLMDWMRDKGLLIVSPSTAARLEGQTQIPLRISPDVPDDAAFVDIGLADRLLQRNGRLSRIVMALSQRGGLPDLQKITPQLHIQPMEDRADMARLTDSFHLNLTAFGFLAFIVGLFIVYSATGLSFEQKRASFRTIRGLGVSLPMLTALLLAEIMVLALLAGMIGVALGYVIASALLPGVSSTLRGLYGAFVLGSLQLRPEWWATGMGMALVGTLLSSIQSLWQVRHMPLLASSQPQAWGLSSARALRFQAVAGAGLLVIALLVALLGKGLVAGFAVLGALLLGAALLLPAFLSKALTGAQRRAKSALSVWFWADTRLQLPGLSLALMALLLALSANIGVGTMVSSFRMTFIGWLDQRLVAELYVTARNDEEAAHVRAWLPEHADAVLPIFSAEGEVRGKPVQISGVADHVTYRDHWPLLSQEPDVWDAVASGDGALINEQLWRAENLKLGEALHLADGWTVRIVGVYSDYGNPRGQLMVGADALTRHYPQASRLRYGVRVEPGRATELKRQMVTEFGLPEGNIVDQAAIKRQSRAVFEQTFTVTAALNILTLGVAGFAMFASLLTLSGARLPQLAPVWAMGIRRRNLALFEVWRTLALWFTTFIFAIPVGLALAWVLLAIVNVEAFGWKLPMMIFPLEWLRLGVIALIAALLSVVLPVRRLASIDPADLLRVFANER
ncbi:putative ABC transport system permease protein [Agrobacterium larrymoorei]|uniref:ABC transport system permease protein n=1 Tax=Agrobacterium larrymoorei TaxID=160699 RepID=A0AAJ2B8Z0_9HYPH|nr:FtsX-like permease family protein [Agrobacterium larrymoorei]MDR6101369.1 putative ABC transport system permease protein [Agrobacterium larrymoorei]